METAPMGLSRSSRSKHATVIRMKTRDRSIASTSNWNFSLYTDAILMVEFHLASNCCPWNSVTLT